MLAELVATLPRNQRRGSRPRCVILTTGSKAQVAARLTDMAAPWAIVNAGDIWMPDGFRYPAEAKLGEDAGFLTPAQRETVMSWWLSVRRNANTPNWDIASTCTVGGKTGLLLVEAQAHSGELKLAGKAVNDKSNKLNHERIGAAICQANKGLDDILPGWNLSRDSNYQLANRFAWVWKIAFMGVPVVLVYLGFLGAGEMCDQGCPFAGLAEWEQAVTGHAKGVVPEEAWMATLDVNGTPLRALIRATAVGLPGQSLL